MNESTKRTHQVVRQAAQDVLQTLDDGRLAVLLARLLVELEGPRQNEQHAADAIVQMEVDPRRQLVPQARGRDAARPDPAALARRLQLRDAQLVDALAVDQDVVAPEREQPRADVAPQEVVRPEGVDAHVATCRDELGAREVVEREVVVEEPGDVDDVLG